MKQKLLFIMIVLVLFVSAVILLQPVKPAHAYVTTAFSVKFTHNDPWYEPHYGAYFAGSSGFSQYYTGPHPPSDYSSFHWWGSSLNVLLLRKSWLFTHTSAWTPDNHHAYF